MLNLGSLDFLNNKIILITGGTGSLGKAISRILLHHGGVRKIIIFSRDELKQFEMLNAFKALDPNNRLRFFLGDIRDKDRCMMAFKGVDFIIHTAALKQVPAAEYNPFEFIKTNILGSQNVIEAAIERNVSRVVALSTDKAANPINLYGSTKFCADKLFSAGNMYSGGQDTRFSVVRYGNVLGSRGSVIPFFARLRHSGVLPITDDRMTRFWITLDQASAFVLNSLRTMLGAEVFVPRIPSMRITDLAKVIAPECKIEIIGIRPGEKLHEEMIPLELGRDTLEFESHYIIKPSTAHARHSCAWGGTSCPEGFSYNSANNDQWMDEAALLKYVLELNLPELSDLKNKK